MPNVQLVSGFQVFSEAEAMESSSLQFHSGVVSACATALQKHQDGQGRTNFVMTLQSQLAESGTFVNQYLKQTQAYWAPARDLWQANRQYTTDTEAEAAESAWNIFVEHSWPKTAIRWGVRSSEHVTGSDIDQQLNERAVVMTSCADLQAVVASTPEPCSALPQFLAAFDKKQCKLLAEMLSKLNDTVTWQQATVVAFLIQDPQEIAALDAVVQKSRVELLVTLTLQCAKFTLAKSDHVNGLYTNGVLTQCDVSIQLYAYASRQMQGANTKSDWKLSLEQWDNDEIRLLSQQDLLDKLQEEIELVLG
ncbi:hypothetical protein ABBQ32_010961 [Trebouxia sp. C0010 RCD-2024]